MRLSRTDLVPVLAIIAGGAVGALTSASLVLLSADDGRATDPVVVAPATAESAPRYVTYRLIRAESTVRPYVLCSDQYDAAIATFEDTNLEARIRDAVIAFEDSKPGARLTSTRGFGALTCGLLSGLTTLDASSAGVPSLAGIQNLTGLMGLRLADNSIADIRALRGLSGLRSLYLQDNPVTDIRALSGLTSLTVLNLTSIPSLSDIQPLLNNPGLGEGDLVLLNETNVSCADVALLEAKGVTVESDCERGAPGIEPDISAAPVFTPFTVAPSILNVPEVQRAMLRAYPAVLRDAGVGGTVRVYFFIDESGEVQDRRVDQSSGHPALDEAALAVADVYRFSPALNRDDPVPVWVSFPVTFRVR